jgi:hypothetical protein
LLQYLERLEKGIDGVAARTEGIETKVNAVMVTQAVQGERMTAQAKSLSALETKGPRAAIFGAAGTFTGALLVAIASFFGFKPGA